MGHVRGSTVFLFHGGSQFPDPPASGCHDQAGPEPPPSPDGILLSDCTFQLLGTLFGKTRYSTICFIFVGDNRTDTVYMKHVMVFFSEEIASRWTVSTGAGPGLSMWKF